MDKETKKLKKDNQLMKDVLHDLVRYLTCAPIQTIKDRKWCLDKIGKVLDEVS